MASGLSALKNVRCCGTSMYSTVPKHGEIANVREMSPFPSVIKPGVESSSVEGCVCVLTIQSLDCDTATARPRSKPNAAMRDLASWQLDTGSRFRLHPSRSFFS